MDDRENIRIDLLKFRRKAYLSYPESSQERKNFLKTVLQTELRLSEREIPQDILNFVIEGHDMVFMDTIKQFLLFTWLAFLSIIPIIFMKHISSLLFFICFFAFGLFLSAAFHQWIIYWNYRKSLKTIKQYSNDMRQHISKLSGDIKRLEGPR